MDTNRPTRVLIIDDDRGLLDAYTVLLEEEFCVFTAATGEEGLALVQREDVDIVLLDLRLPGMDGLEVLRHLKARAVPAAVLMLTAVNEAGLAMEAVTHGAAAYLVKPVDNAELLAYLRQVHYLP
jgi:DNA-binding response OmpR family regulator